MGGMVLYCVVCRVFNINLAL